MVRRGEYRAGRGCWRREYQIVCCWRVSENGNGTKSLWPLPPPPRSLIVCAQRSNILHASQISSAQPAKPASARPCSLGCLQTANSVVGFQPRLVCFLAKRALPVKTAKGRPGCLASRSSSLNPAPGGTDGFRSRRKTGKPSACHWGFGEPIPSTDRAPDAALPAPTRLPFQKHCRTGAGIACNGTQKP